jgi:hypothetical protein
LKTILANQYLYTQKYVQSTKNTSTHYQNANGLSLKSIGENYNESFCESEGESG